MSVLHTGNRFFLVPFICPFLSNQSSSCIFIPIILLILAREVRLSGRFSDVTLASEDGHKVTSLVYMTCQPSSLPQVPCHKVILCSSSPHLFSLLSSPHTSPVVLPGIKIQLLETILDFIYHGEVIIITIIVFITAILISTVIGTFVIFTIMTLCIWQVEVAKPDLYSFLAMGEKLQLKGLVKPTKEETTAPKDKEEEVAPKEKEEMVSLKNEKIKTETEVTASVGEDVYSFIEKNGKVWTCLKCGKTASSWNERSNLKKHVLIHQVGKVLRCTICGKESKTQNGLGQHTVKHHSSVKASSAGQEQLVVDKTEDEGETVGAAEEYEDALKDLEEEVEDTYNKEVEDTFNKEVEDTYNKEVGDTYNKEVEDTYNMKTSKVNMSMGSQMNKTANGEEWKQKVDSLIEKVGNFWRCVECGKTAEEPRDRYKLKAHVEKHLTGIVHTCELCGHKSPTSTALGQHKHKKHREELQRIMKAVMKYKCKFCGKGSRTRKGLERHRYKNHKNEPKPKVEDEEKPFKCQICGKGSRSKKGLENHTYKNHKNELRPIVEDEEKPFKCQICGKGSRSKKGLEGHTYKNHKNALRSKVEEENKPFKCKICGKGSISEKGRAGHMFKRHRGTTFVEGKYKCDVCDKGSKTNKGMEQHKYKYHNKNGRYFGEKTSRRSLTGSEEKGVTTKQESYIECHEEALAEEISVQIERMKEEVERLKEQTKDISLEKLENYQQENISYEDGAQIEDKLLVEERLVEEDSTLQEERLLEENTVLEEVDIEVEDSEFNGLDLVELHQKSVSLCVRDGDTWTCTKCGRKAEDKYKHNLFRHAEVHLEGLTFPCNECPKISRSSSGLYQHKAKVHTKGKVASPYNCAICGRGSKTSKGLEIHRYKYHKAVVQSAE